MSKPQLPELTHLQFLVLGVLRQADQPGRALRDALSGYGFKRTGPAFYQLMARLEKERQAREDALRAIQELEAKLLSEKSAKDAAGRAATDAKLALEKERMAREAVERAAREGGARAGKSSSSNGKDASFGKDKGAQIETSATPTATPSGSAGRGSTSSARRWNTRCIRAGHRSFTRTIWTASPPRIASTWRCESRFASSFECGAMMACIPGC